MNPSSVKLNITLGLALVMALSSARFASAQETGTADTWNGGTGNWATANNPPWSLGTVPNSSDDAEFTGALSAAQTITMSGTANTAQGLYFGATGFGTALSGGTLQLGADGIYIASGQGGVTFSTSFELTASQTWNNASSQTNVGTNSGIGFTSDSAVTTPVTLTIENTGSGSWDFKGAIVNNNVTGSNSGTVAVIFNVTNGGFTIEGTGGNSTNSGGDTLQNGSLTIKSAPTGVINTASPLGLGTLTFGTGSAATNQLFINAAATYNFSNSSVVLMAGDSTTIDENNSGDVAIFSGVISGSGTLTQSSNAGAFLNLTNANTYSGGTTVAAGVLDINNGGTSSANSAIGTGALTITGGTINNTSGSAIALGTNNAINLNGTATFGSATSTSANSINFGSGTVSMGASRTVAFVSGSAGDTITFGKLTNTATGNTAPSLTVNGAGNTLALGAFVLGSNNTTAITETLTGTGNISVTGTISNGTALANNLTYSGSGTLSLSGSNTYTGSTTISSGTAFFNTPAGGSATGTGSLTVAAGATIGGNGTSSGTGFKIAGTGTATRANILVGLTSATDTTVSNVLTLKGSTGVSTIADANLTFNLDATSTNSTQLNVGATNVAFGTDVGSVKLTLNVQNEPAIVGAYTTYTLIAGTGTTSTTGGTSGGQYTGLTLGASTAVGGGTETIITGNNLQLAFGSTLDQSYYGNGSYLVLYQSSGVDDIDVVVVPEPGTWAMMLGGLAVLIVWQRRKRNT